MAPKATVVKVELQVSDMDRHYYATHMLTLAQHPSETDERLMVRLLAFALFADERLEFGRGLSSEDEADLWRRNYSGDIEQWIDLGQPDESRIKKACGRAQQVVVVNYSGNGAAIWWNRIAPSLSRIKNLTVIDIPSETVESLATLIQRGMRLNCLIQDGELQLMSDTINVALHPTIRMAAADA
ncbi:MAG TPA: YaeQ family protein [Luteimonas sp.]|nr:YaeQ family protein [Luteimonas sp.]